MAGTGLHVKYLTEVKRLWQLGLKNRQIARTLRVHRNTINKYVDKFRAEKESKNNEIVSTQVESSKANWFDELDWIAIRTEYLSGVSLNVIHEELVESKKVSVQYAGFWKQAQKKISLTEATMVRIFKPGDRAEIDYADGIDILDPVTGEIRRTEFFVGSLCHSRYTFGEFTFTQSSQDFLQSHVNMFDFFGGATQVLSPDNLKSAVTKAHRYDPVINPAYAKLAEYYEVAVVPARVRTPKDKAIVERSIQIFQRYFFMKVRHKTFTSLIELNQVLREHLDVFNGKLHRIFRRTRREMFLAEKPYLKALPQDPYKVAVYGSAVLGRDCHLIFDKSFYSAPHELRGKELDIWATSKVVEIFYEAERVALHARSKVASKFLTNTKHYPPAQAAYAEEDVQKMILRSERIGTETQKLIKSLLESPEPLKHFRRSQGILALSWKYSGLLLEGACKEANRFNNTNIKYLERVIIMGKGVTRKVDDEVKPRAHNPHLRGLDNIH